MYKKITIAELKEKGHYWIRYPGKVEHPQLMWVCRNKSNKVWCCTQFGITFELDGKAEIYSIEGRPIPEPKIEKEVAYATQEQVLKKFEKVFELIDRKLGIKKEK